MRVFKQVGHTGGGSHSNYLYPINSYFMRGEIGRRVTLSSGSGREMLSYGTDQ